MGKQSKSRRSKKKNLKRKKNFPRSSLSKQVTVSPVIVLQRAYAFMQKGNRAEAEHLVNSLLHSEYKEKNPVYLHKLGLITHLLGKSDIGLHLLQKSIDLQPSASSYNDLGYILEQAGDMDGAKKSYGEAIKLDPGFPFAHYNLANMHQYNLQFEEAIKHYQQAVHFKPDYVAAFNNLAFAQKRLGDFEQAERSCRNALQIDPSNSEAISTWCQIMIQKEDSEKILEICEKALGFVRKKELIYSTMADTLAQMDRKVEALDVYRKALDFSTDQGKIYFQMSKIKEYLKTDDDIAAMQKRFELLPDGEEKRFLCFALGKAYEDVGEYSKAFQCIEKGNTLTRKSYFYSTADDKKFFEDIISSFNPHFLEQANRLEKRNPTPIFIVGMPRSGTTLVEHILACHSRVFAAGELMEFEKLVNKTIQVKGLSSIGEGIRALELVDYENIGTQYVSYIKKLNSEAEFIIDKLPHNFLWIGLIRVAIPEAKIIHCTREPMDTCWSIYKNLFSIPHKYSHDLVELGNYYRIYQEIMNHWKAMMMDEICEIEYEKIVQSQERETRRLLEYCNLSWEDACLDFYKSKRKVFTSSMNQVRNPIYSSSVNKWKCLESELKALHEIIYA